MKYTLEKQHNTNQKTTYKLKNGEKQERVFTKMDARGLTVSFFETMEIYGDTCLLQDVGRKMIRHGTGDSGGVYVRFAWETKLKTNKSTQRMEQNCGSLFNTVPLHSSKYNSQRLNRCNRELGSSCTTVIAIAHSPCHRRRRSAP